MAALLKFFLVALLATTAIWVSVALYLRSLRAERLEREWASRAGRTADEDRESFVDAGLRDFDRALKRWSLVALWGAALAAVAAIIYHMNYN